MSNLIQEFAETDKGREHIFLNNIGLIQGRLVYMKFSIKASGGLYDPYVLKNPVKEKWD
jgi:hypothetical protein